MCFEFLQKLLLTLMMITMHTTKTDLCIKLDYSGQRWEKIVQTLGDGGQALFAVEITILVSKIELIDGDKFCILMM